MKKIITLLLLGILIFPLVSSTDIAYVLKNPSRPDAQFVNAINELGYTHDLIDNSDISSTDFSNYAMILLGNENIDDVPVNQYPSLIANKRYFDGWSSDVDYITSSQPLTAYNSNQDHLITEGVRRYFQAYTRARLNGLSVPLYFLSGPKFDAEKITTTGDTTSKLGEYVIATKENPNRVFFGITRSDYWTSDTKKLFKNSLQWLVEGEENFPPVFTGTIPTISWERGETKQIDLSNYFSDSNDDQLTYTVHDTSDNQDISLEIQGSLVTFSSTPGWTGEDWVIFNATDSKETAISNRITLRVLTGQEPVQGEFEFTDISQCSLITSELEIKIKEPDDGDDFEIGDTIKGEIELENNADEDMDVEVEFYLYDLDEDEVVEDTDDEIDVDEDDDEKLEFEIEIPEDLEDHDFAIFVKAEANEDQDYCNQEYVEIEIERPDDKLIIEEIKISPERPKKGDDVRVEVKIQNVGEDEQDFYIEVEIKELNIKEKTSTFEIEEYDEEDTETKTISIKIPEDAENKQYDLKVTLYYNDETSETKTFRVGKTTSGSSSGVFTQTETPISLGASTTILPKINISKTPGTPLTTGNAIKLKEQPTFQITEKQPTKSQDQTYLEIHFEESEEPVKREPIFKGSFTNYIQGKTLTTREYLVSLDIILLLSILVVIVAIIVWLRR
jgi:hypothetical protein